MQPVKSAYTLVIEAESASELKSKVLDAASQYGGQSVTAPPVKVELPNTLGVAAPKEAPKSAKPKAAKGAPKATPDTDDPFADEAAENAVDTGTAAVVSDDPFAEDEAPAPAAKAAAAPAKKVYTFDDIKAALQQVADKDGDQEQVKEIIKDLDVAKVSAIKEADYPKCIALCQKALK